MSDQEANQASTAQAQMPNTTNLVHRPANAEPDAANLSLTTPPATTTSDPKAATAIDKSNKHASSASGSGSKSESGESNNSFAATLITSASPLHGIGLFTTVAVADGDLVMLDEPLLVIEASNIPNQHSFLDQARHLDTADKLSLIHI